MAGPKKIFKALATRLVENAIFGSLFEIVYRNRRSVVPPKLRKLYSEAAGGSIIPL